MEIDRQIRAGLYPNAERIAQKLEVSERVEQACAAFNFPREDKPRVPHVTLARVEQARPHGPLSAWLTAASAARLGARL